MPTYEYLCKNCGERFEKVQSFSSRPLKTHAACGGELQKVFHASGVVFKGPGFYATDNRPAAKTAPVDASDSKSDSTQGSDRKSDKETPKKSPAKKESPAAAAAD